MAQHGHDHDPNNRYQNGLVAIGDAIVIELVYLPLLVSQKLGISENDDCLHFLYELDNLGTHNPIILAQWIMIGLSSLKEKFANANTPIEQACLEIVRRLQDIEKTVSFESFRAARWWIDFLLWLVPLMRINWIDKLSHLKPKSSSWAPYPELAVQDLISAIGTGSDYRYVVYGHTHIPELVPFRIGGRATESLVYFNTGTWRRVHRSPTLNVSEDKTFTFISWEEETAVLLYSDQEQQSLKLPPYEFYHLKRGL
jgi:hypothetical protein